MDSVFLLEGEALANFLQSIGQALGCTYICLWSYLPPLSNYLTSTGGWYKDDSNQPSSSSASFPRSLFDEYRRCYCSIENGSVPGYALTEGMHFLELQDFELLNLASTEIQRQFYQEARIKTAVFNGCRSGVMELGMSTPTHKNMQQFVEDFIQQYQKPREPRLPDHSLPSSSSSSLRSLSVGSPEYSSFLLNLVSASFATDPIQGTPIEQAIRPTSIAVPTHQLTMQAYSQLRNIQFPTPTSEDAAMTRAMLAVISSPSSSSSSYHTQNPTRLHRRTAFRTYDSALAPIAERSPSSYGQNKTKRLFDFLRTIRKQTYGIRPTTNQLHHMISERKRREKLNENFLALKALLPPGSKKDKASVLSNTREYLNALKAQVLELQERNQSLEAQLSSEKEAYEEAGSSAGSERAVVQVIESSESSSEEMQIELRVIMREEDCGMTDLLLRLLECLKHMQNVTLVSVDADIQLQQMNPINRAILRLKIKTSEWDRESFKEALTRAVGGVARGETSIS